MRTHHSVMTGERWTALGENGWEDAHSHVCRHVIMVGV